MSKILLSIKPEYVEKILSGTKKYEYRKRIASDDIEAIVIYSTYPVSKIVGEVSVIGTVSASPSKIWEDTKKSAGISRKGYREYFYKCKTAYAYILGNVIIYDKPKDISEYGLKQAPQSFVYISGT